MEKYNIKGANGLFYRKMIVLNNKPFLGRFWLYRLIKGGTWRKYSYTIAGNIPWGSYWTQEDDDGKCINQLRKVKEVNY